MEISYVCLEIIVNAKCWHVLVAHISMCPQRCPAMSSPASNLWWWRKYIIILNAICIDHVSHTYVVRDGFVFAYDSADFLHH